MSKPTAWLAVAIGKRAVICQPGDLVQAIAGKLGTIVDAEVK